MILMPEKMILMMGKWILIMTNSELILQQVAEQRRRYIRDLKRAMLTYWACVGIIAVLTILVWSLR